MRASFLLAAAAAVFLAPAAIAQTVPDGTYGCLGYMGPTLMPMGTIEIRGSTFRYAPPGGKLGAFRPYVMNKAGKITWNGPMGALNDPGVITDSFLEVRPAYRSIIVKHKPKPEAYIMTMGCRNDTKPGH